MYFAMIAAAFTGFVLGMGGMYFFQRKYRKQELDQLADLTEDILNGREIRAAASGKETLYTWRYGGMGYGDFESSRLEKILYYRYL